jgi:putative inorganic carbon (HCO3(-)) transporter
MTNFKFLISNKIYLVGFFLILTLPLLNLPPWFSPPDWGKTIVFRVILSILIFALLSQILSSGGPTSDRFSRGVKVGLFLLLALFLVYFLATIFSLDRNFSLWGSPYRSGGFVNFAFYIIFAILAFLILDESNWKKIWDFAIIIGILVSLIAIFQQFGLFSKILITFENRPPSTLGGPIFLAIYLLLLSFPTFSFGIEAGNLFKKFFYFFSFLLFVFVAIFITQTRAVMVGFLVGFLYFIFFFPFKKRSISLALKIIIFILFLSGMYGFYYLNTKSIPNFIQENKLLSGITQRILIKNMLSDARISDWKVSWQALKAKPILGYGPENFSIGFDKYYNPALPNIEEMLGELISWWDRAHNFLLDIGVTAGIPALIIYLLLFGVLFLQLQRTKNQHKSAQISINQCYIPHGIQATFLAYLVANFFSFDTFSTYLISFLLIGYSLHLISTISINQQNQYKSASHIKKEETLPTKLYKYRGLIIFLLFLLLIWFIWVFNIKPLEINSQINTVRYLANNKKCPQAILKMEEILPQKSFLDAFLRLRYFETLERCGNEISENTLEFTKKKIKLLQETIEIQPYYTRSWISLGSLTNVLIESEENPEMIKKLKQEANDYFEKAHQLSPKRQGVFIEWIITDLLTGEYQKAKEKSQQCIDLNERLEDCWWQMALTNIYLDENEKAKENIKIAAEKGYTINSEVSLLELAKAYFQNKDYQELIEIYQKLVELKPENPTYHISLLVVLKEAGNFGEAKKEALKIIELFPNYKEEIESFLKQLP